MTCDISCIAIHNSSLIDLWDSKVSTEFTFRQEVGHSRSSHRLSINYMLFELQLYECYQFGHTTFLTYFFHCKVGGCYLKYVLFHIKSLIK